MLNLTYFFCSFFALDNYVLGPSPVLALVLFLVLANTSFLLLPAPFALMTRVLPPGHSSVICCFCCFFTRQEDWAVYCGGTILFQLGFFSV